MQAYLETSAKSKTPTPQPDCERCCQPAAFYAVHGKSFSCFANLCETHRDDARHDGFILEVVHEA